MKKIYILTAVFALLTLSLNAQVRTTSERPVNSKKTGFVAPHSSIMEKVGSQHKAPLRYDLADDEYLFGPYDTDDYSSTGVGLYNIDYSTGTNDFMEIYVGIPRAEFEEHLGDEILGFRFAVTQQIRMMDFSVYTAGPNGYWNAIVYTQFNGGSYSSYYNGGQWLEFTFNNPITFEVPDSVNIIWLGYGYYQPSSSSNYNKPIGQNPNSTGHNEMAYSNYYGSFYNATEYFSGDLAVQLIMRHSLEKTATPVITVSQPDANGNVTVTATGNGTVTLTIDGQTVTGNGTASITLTPSVSSYTVTATATAQEDGKAVSDPATREVTVTPVGGEWLEMYGTYDNPNDLLSLESLEVDEDGNHLEIMLIDQFLASTFDNEHSNKYTYTLRETVNNEEKSSNAVNIPVYKTNSSIQGLYTKKQVDEDIDMHLKANALNSEMHYDVHPEHSTLYYSLYRGDLNAAYPVIDAPHRISQLQKFEEKVGENNIQYFLFENHPVGIAPRYDRLGDDIAERLDTNYVQGNYNDELSYVPVIWTYGLYTARGDGKNNSYGSDIKREKLGNVTVKIKGSKSGGNNVEDTGAGWEGLFKVGNEWYCIYTPIIDITGIVPCDGENVQNDGDVNSYVPYMYRAWCLYPGARSFKHVAQTNSQGQTVQVLADDGELTIPYLLGTNQVEASHTQIGQAWQNGQPKLQWAFGVPVSEDPANVPIAVRFYYKKNVTNASPSTLRAGKRADGEVDENSEEYYIVQVEGTADELVTSINEFYAGKAVVGVTYVNSLGMHSDKPFDGLNIVVTRYSDGTTSTSKVMR